MAGNNDFVGLLMLLNMKLTSEVSSTSMPLYSIWSYTM